MPDKEEVVELRPGGAAKTDLPTIESLTKPRSEGTIRYSFEFLLALQDVEIDMALVAMDVPPEIDVNGKGFTTARGHDLNSRASLSDLFSAATQSDGFIVETPIEPVPAWKAKTRERSGSGSMMPSGQPRGGRHEKAGRGERGERGARDDRDRGNRGQPEWRGDRGERTTILGRKIVGGTDDPPGRGRQGGQDRGWKDAERSGSGSFSNKKEPRGRREKADLWDDAATSQTAANHDFRMGDKVLTPFFAMGDDEPAAPPGLKAPPGLEGPPGLEKGQMDFFQSFGGQGKSASAPAAPSAAPAKGRSRFSQMFTEPEASQPSAASQLDGMFAASAQAPQPQKPPEGAGTKAPSEADIMAKLMGGGGPSTSAPAPNAPSEADIMAKLMGGNPQPSAPVSVPAAVPSVQAAAADSAKPVRAGGSRLMANLRKSQATDNSKAAPSAPAIGKPPPEASAPNTLPAPNIPKPAPSEGSRPKPSGAKGKATKPTPRAAEIGLQTKPDVMKVLQPALFNPGQQPNSGPAGNAHPQSQQPRVQAVPRPKQQQQQQQQPRRTSNPGGPPPPLNVGPPPPLNGMQHMAPPPPLIPGQTFNPGQFFNMFEGVNMHMSTPSGSGAPAPMPGMGPPAPINMGNMGFMSMPAPLHPQQQQQRQQQQQQRHPQQQQRHPQQQQQQQRHPQQRQQQPQQQQFMPPPQPMPGMMQAPGNMQGGMPPNMVFSADAFFAMANGQPKAN